MSRRVQGFAIASGLALAGTARAQDAARAGIAEWSTLLLAIGVVTAIAGFVGGLRYATHWAAAHGHAPTFLERALFAGIGGVCGLLVPALIQLLTVASR